MLFRSGVAVSILILVIAVPPFASGQQRDSNAPMQGVAVPWHGIKCGFPHIMQQLQQSMQEGDAAAALRKTAAAPGNRQKSLRSPSGHFIIYYDTTGNRAAAMLDGAGNRIPNSSREYVDSLARAFDESYHAEVDILGYEAPPLRSGTTAYEIYVSEKQGSDYGYTSPVDQVGSGTAAPMFTTYIDMDNDYKEFPTTGIPAAKVTAAHEFHHAIQIGRYGSWMDHLYIHEMTSTCMEEIVYPEVNDYIQYLEPYMQNPNQSLYAWDGYEAVLWPLRMHVLYGPAAWLNVWKRCRDEQPMAAIRSELDARGSSLAGEFCDYARDIYWTGYRARIGNLLFEDAPLYPAARITKDVALGDSSVHAGSVPILGVRYYRVSDGADTLTLSISGVDEDLAVQRSQARLSYRIVVKRNSGDPSMTQLSGGWAYRLESASASSLCVGSLDAVPTGVTGPARPETPALAPFPQPFIPAVHAAVSIPVPGTSLNAATVTIYSLEGRTVRVLRSDAMAGSAAGRFSWDGLDSQGRNIPSGVYLYRVAGDPGSSYHGKISLIQTAH